MLQTVQYAERDAEIEAQVSLQNRIAITKMCRKSRRGFINNSLAASLL